MNLYGTNCDIYIGKNAGKPILEDLKKVKKSIKIVSPYLSPNLISNLIELQKEGIDIFFITSDDIEDYRKEEKKNINKLIIQYKKTNSKALIIRKFLQFITALLIISTFCFSAFLIRFYSPKDIKENKYIIITFIGLIITIIFFRFLTKRLKVYSYWYKKLFPFKVFMSRSKTKEETIFVHSKIYIIDDEVLYLGSLNFTTSGLSHNYETIIRTKDSLAIDKVNKEILNLAENSNIPERDISSWGSELYDEPIN